MDAIVDACLMNDIRVECKTSSWSCRAPFVGTSVELGRHVTVPNPVHLQLEDQGGAIDGHVQGEI